MALADRFRSEQKKLILSIKMMDAIGAIGDGITIGEDAVFRNAWHCVSGFWAKILNSRMNRYERREYCVWNEEWQTDEKG